ncbi:MAG: hypothetical protein HYW25_00490 [Candidatus Aenigmarchaeota archaeon]|nr:hypothetical protein [Candidatus Aenigmarchaeota archaeon]
MNKYFIVLLGLIIIMSSTANAVTSFVPGSTVPGGAAAYATAPIPSQPAPSPYSAGYLVGVMPYYCSYCFGYPYYYNYPYYGYYPNYFYTLTYSTPGVHVSYTNYGGVVQSATVVVKKNDWFLLGGFSRTTTGTTSGVILDKRSLFAMG